MRHPFGHILGCFFVVVSSLSASSCTRSHERAATPAAAPLVQARGRCPEALSGDARLCSLIAELDRRRRLQECAWILAEHGYTKLADSYLRYILRELSEGDIVDRDRIETGLGSGTGENYIVTFTSGLKGVFKPRAHMRYPYVDIAAYEVDRLLGMHMVPVTTVRVIGARLGSMQLYLDGTGNGWDDLFRWRTKKMQFFDALIGNPDRHRGNWLFTYPVDFEGVEYATGRQIAIDNDRAFSYEEMLGRGGRLPHGTGPVFESYEREFYERLSSVKEITWRAALEQWLDDEQLDRFLLARKQILEDLCARRDPKLGCLPK